MQYINDIDYDYIINKHHDASKPWNGMGRFVRRDEIFDPATGMDADALRDGFLAQDEALKDHPHPIRKARALEFIMKNTRISCDPRDRYPSVNANDRPLKKTIVDEWKREVLKQIVPEIGAKRSYFEKEGIVTIWPDYDHSMPMWERVLSLGFAGLLRESEKARHAKEWDEEQEIFFEGIKITYEAILTLVDRFATLAENTEGSERMAKALRQLEKGAPKNFYEALLLDYLYFLISEHIDYLQVRSLGNFDRLFYPYYKADLERGITEEEIRTDIAYFLAQFVAISNYWNQPVYLGGEKADGSTEINELSYLFLDVYDKMGIYTPKIQIKVGKSTPKDFVCKALDMIRRGNNSIVFVNDDTMQKALLREGATKEEARLCHVTGCYEYSRQDSYFAQMNMLNLLKPFEYTLHEGYDPITGNRSGLPCPPPSAFESFDDLLAEFKRQFCHIVNEAIEVVNGFEGYLSYMNPLSMLSATFPTCLERGRDAIVGGARYNDSTIAFGGLADLGDSLMMIKKYVYEQKKLTLSEFVSILDQNFEGHETFRQMLLRDREKYGNNLPRADEMTISLAKFCIDHVYGRPNAKERGGIWKCNFHVARHSYIWGDKTAACPSGRKCGEELSKNLSPALGQAREGITATVLSFTKLDNTVMASNFSLDLAFLPSAVRGEEGLEAMYGVLMTFNRRGGHAVHFNVFDAEMLREAQANPEKYADLQIRVSGWNVLWNNIDRWEQDGFIRQAEAL
ncbi:MAG: hypothetical protein J6Q82_03260 [Clostridia bacterium]|nr:hypothetical protein [Clostridia bacterium]